MNDEPWYKKQVDLLLIVYCVTIHYTVKLMVMALAEVYLFHDAQSLQYYSQDVAAMPPAVLLIAILFVVLRIRTRRREQWAKRMES